jgi:ketosteroid isomerase-like protein
VGSENVDLLREVYVSWGRGEFSLDPRLPDEFTITMGADFPDAGVHSRIAGVAAYMRGFLEPWERLTIEVEELTDVGDRVLARVLQSGTGVSSGIAVELRYFQLWTFEAGRPVAMETIMHEVDARAKLEAA